MQLATNLSSPGLLTAVLITLSVGMASGRQCYWCGPLAEQVHRSRRAPSCASTGRHVTVCEPGYSNCAVVATAPPYVESRYCVKVYQDECYPQFCNTTKTWRMTCPCRGDLCNGANGDREADAFEVLNKLVSKTHSRIKKRAPNSKQRKIVSPKDEPELIDNSLEVNERSETKTSPPVLEGRPESQTVALPDAQSVSTSPSSDLPKQITTTSDSSTIVIETLSKQSNPTDSSYKTSDVSIKTSPEPAIQNDDDQDAALYKHDEADVGEEISITKRYPKNKSMQEVSSTLLPTALVSFIHPFGESSNSRSSTSEIPLTNAKDGTAHIASTVPSIMATDSNTPTVATKYLTSPIDQTPANTDSKSSTNSNIKLAETPTAEAFLQPSDTSAAAKDKDEKTQTASEVTQPSPSETLHSTTEILTAHSTTTTMRTSNAPNASESANKRSKNKNAAITIQTSILSIIHGIIISRIM